MRELVGVREGGWDFRLPVQAARGSAGCAGRPGAGGRRAGRRGELGQCGRHVGAHILQLRDVAAQGFQRVFPQARFDRRLRQPDLPPGFVLGLAQQIEAARRQEGSRQEQGHDSQPGNRK